VRRKTTVGVGPKPYKMNLNRCKSPCSS